MYICIYVYMYIYIYIYNEKNKQNGSLLYPMFKGCR